MPLPALAPERRYRQPVRRNGILQLGQPHFWLLAGILGFTLSLVVLVFFAHWVSV
jgi:hypothetical protein